jgi:hypothetical protein
VSGKDDDDVRARLGNGIYHDTQDGFGASVSNRHSSNK